MMYDINYYEKMLREYSSTAESICKIRWDWISEVNPKKVLDYGSGVGWFRAWRPEIVDVRSYDIAKYPQTGIELAVYDVVCFWDSLEHIPDFRVVEPVLRLARNVAASLPMKIEMADFSTWKHFKPTEHLHYFTEETIDALLCRYGFKRKKIGQPECPPREGITSVLYEKINS